jgi:demethylmenaquinone methyltransferase/2-methoxy-6-polyprenyl-1,4-benzoquinol methylase
MGAPPGPMVAEMFGEVAPRYDRLNRLLSLGLDRRWRRETVRALGLPAGARLLDLCCGTGDLALEGARAGLRVTGADFAGPMLTLAERKFGRARVPREGLFRADAQALPFADGGFDGVAIAFGIRNVADPRRALRECRRALRPGGCLAVLEFFRVPNPAWRGLFRLYFPGLMPLAARAAGAPRPQAYRYLPESVDAFAAPAEFRAWMREAGFADHGERSFSGGVARLLLGRAAAEPGA